MNVIERIFQKLINKIKNKLHKAWKTFDKDDVLDKYTQAGVDIFTYTLLDNNNVKYLSSKENTKMYIVTKEYVMNKDISTFIVFDYNMTRYSKLTTVNHEYKYDYEIPAKTAAKMKDLFDNKVEEDRLAMEAEILSNITSSIQILVQRYRDKLEEQQ